MKIAFYIGSLAQGGAERVIVNLASYFKQIGWEVVMVNYFVGKNEYTLPEGIDRHFVDLTKKEISKSRITNFYRRFKKLRDVWKSERPDVIVSFIGKTNIMTLATTRLLHIPVAVSVRSVPAREYASKSLQLGMKYFFPKADGVILQTNQAKEYFPSNIQNKVKILPNSLNPSFIRPIFEGERRKEIISVGRIDDNKNQKMLVEAFEELINESDVAKDWKVVLYGDGPKRKELEAYCQERGLGEAIIFMGAQSDIPEKIKESAIFVLPSKQEGMPNALIEAMALGLGVISTDCPCGGPADLIRDGENGYLIPVDGKKELKERLYYLMNHPEQVVEFGKRASKVQETLHPDKVNEMWRNYLEGLTTLFS